MFHLMIPQYCPTGVLEITLLTGEYNLLVVPLYMSLKIELSYCLVATLSTDLGFVTCNLE